MLYLAIGLLVAAVVLCFVELFLPSMGLITAAGLLCAAGSCWAAFAVSTNIGWVFMALNVAGVASAFAVAFKYMPKSPMALKKAKFEDGGYEHVERPGGLVGKTGVAFTMLRPGGTALIDGHKVDVVALGGVIEKDARVKVVAVEGARVTVEREVL